MPFLLPHEGLDEQADKGLREGARATAGTGILVVFRTESEKRNFLESVGQDPDRNAINFEEFRRMLS